MKLIIDKKLYQGKVPIYFILIILFFLTSCKGQENGNLRQLKVNPPKEDSSNLVTPKKDNLFFIDGQLCQHLRKIFQDKSGKLWFGTNVYDVMCYNGDSLVYYSETDGFSGGRVTGIVEDKDGNIWFGTSEGLTKYDHALVGTGANPFTVYTEKDGLLNNEIWSILIDGKGIFWIGTNAGVSRFDPSQIGTDPFRLFSQGRYHPCGCDQGGYEK